MGLSRQELMERREMVQNGAGGSFDESFGGYGGGYGGGGGYEGGSGGGGGDGHGSRSDEGYLRLRNKTAYEFAVPSLEPAVIGAFILSRVLVSHLWGIMTLHVVRWAWALGVDVAVEKGVAGFDYWVRPIGFSLLAFVLMFFLVGVAAIWLLVVWMSAKGWNEKFWIWTGTILILIGSLSSLVHLR